MDKTKNQQFVNFLAKLESVAPKQDRMAIEKVRQAFYKYHG